MAAAPQRLPDFLVLGTQKGGTTSLQQLLGHHPEVFLAAGKEEDEAIRHLFQRLAVLLVKGNAALLVNRIPSHPLPSANGEL